MQVNFYKIPLDMTVRGLNDYFSSFEFFILKHADQQRRCQTRTEDSGPFREML